MFDAREHSQINSAGRDIYNQKSTVDISLSALDYLIKELKQCKRISDVYQEAVVDCFHCMTLEQRTKVSKKIMRELKRIKRES